MFTKNDMIDTMANKGEISKLKARDLYNIFVDTVTAKLLKGDQVEILGLGTFKVKKAPAHNGFNPITKEPLKCPARTKPMFKISVTLKRALKSK